MSLEEQLQQAGDQRRARGLERKLEESPSGLIDFASNDHLGLTRDPALIAAAKAALEGYGAGGRAARLLGGGSLEREVERRAAAWLATEDALLFPSGYQANLGLVTALASRCDALFSDALNHASLIDAARLSRAHVHVFAHADPSALEGLLQRPSARAARRRLVLTESVFSMDGDLAPLEELARVCEAQDAWLIVDEAHAAGLLGPARQGAAHELNSPRLLARVITGGKALGSSGALVAGSAALITELVNCARSFIFTTAPVPAAVAALGAAIELVQASGERSERALAAARRLATALALPRPAAAIVPVVIGAEQAALEAAAELQRQGFDVRAVRPPTVPPGTSRLRISFKAQHTDACIDQLAQAIRPFVTSPAKRSARADPKRPRPLVVAGTDTDIGKTVVSALLLRAALRVAPAAYWKPVQTGTDSDTRTVAKLNNLDATAFAEPAYEFPLPASPHTAAKAAQVQLDPGRVVPPEGSDLTICELAGGLLVPWTDDFMQVDWLVRTPHELVLVARSGLGTLNHTLLSLEALRARGLEPRALFLVGEPHAPNHETLTRLGQVARIYEVPRFEPLTTEALDAWLDAHDLEELIPNRSRS